VEFALNSTISSSLGFTPFELNYGYSPIINPGLAPELSSMPGVKHFVLHALQNLAHAHDAILESRVCQTHHANRHHREDDIFAAGDLVYVSTVDLSLLKGQAIKLLPKYVGPFKIIDVQPSRPYHANDDVLFPHREAHKFYDFGMPDDQEWLVEEILAHQWDKDHLSFQVLWNLGDTTWEPYAVCKDLQALDDYL
jgi:hypothetical protein